MKTNRILLTATLCLAVLLATSCVNYTIRLGQGGQKIKPSKNIVEKVYEQPAFDELEATLMANVKIIQSAKDGHRVVLQCPDNYLELFSIKVEEGELKLDFAVKNAIIETSDVKILVYTPTLRKIESNGVAMIKADSLRADQLEVENNGVGSIKLNGLKVNHIDCELNGVGDPGRTLQRVCQALHSGRNLTAGDSHLLRLHICSVSADYCLTPVLYCQFNAFSQFALLGHHILLQMDSEQFIVVIGVSEHVAVTHKADDGFYCVQVVFQPADHDPHLLGRHLHRD